MQDPRSALAFASATCALEAAGFVHRLPGFCVVGAILDAGEKPPEQPDEKTVLQNTVRINRRSQNPDAKRVEGITDVDFFAALDLDREQLKAVKTAVDRQDHDAAWKGGTTTH